MCKTYEQFKVYFVVRIVTEIEDCLQTGNSKQA